VSPLERLGFAVAASRWLEVRLGVGGVLSVLVAAAPEAVPYERLVETAGVGRPHITRASLSALVCHLREALADVGFENAIATEREFGFRYAGDVTAIRQAVERFA